MVTGKFKMQIENWAVKRTLFYDYKIENGITQIKQVGLSEWIVSNIPKGAVLLMMLMCLTFCTFAQCSTDTVTVVQVHDGDSFRVKMKNNAYKWVRLAYVDCPEVISNYVTQKQPYGDSAANNVREIIKGRKMLMRCFKYDIYHRPIVSLSAIGDNDFDLARLIISHGYGWYIPTVGIPKPYRIRKGLKLQREALRFKLGLWQLPNPIKPKIWRRTHKPVNHFN